MTAYLKWASKPALAFVSDIQPSATECISSPHDVVATAANPQVCCVVFRWSPRCISGPSKEESLATHQGQVQLHPSIRLASPANRRTRMLSTSRPIAIPAAWEAGTRPWYRYPGPSSGPGSEGSRGRRGPMDRCFRVSRISQCARVMPIAVPRPKGHSGPSACAQVKDRPKTGRSKESREWYPGGVVRLCPSFISKRIAHAPCRHRRREAFRQVSDSCWRFVGLVIFFAHHRVL